MKIGGKILYICHPYKSNPQLNRIKALKFAEKISTEGGIPITPHVLFPFLNDENPYDRAKAMSYCIELLSVCHFVAVCGSIITEGMKIELEEAKKLSLPIIYLETDI